MTWTTKALLDTVGQDEAEEFTKCGISYLQSTHISAMVSVLIKLLFKYICKKGHARNVLEDSICMPKLCTVSYS